jgi:iron-sulfur cluster assembly protein
MRSRRRSTIGGRSRRRSNKPREQSHERRQHQDAAGRECEWRCYRHRVIAEQGFAEASTWVRIGAKGGGCSGFTYVLDFDQNGPTEFDLTFTQHGVNVIVDKKSEFFMGGTHLDFNDGLLDRGFVFKNPQASGTCGCGTSFSA